MRLVHSFLAALAKADTYHPLRNPYVVFGFLWGLPIPIVLLAFHLWVSGRPDLTLIGAIREQPLHLFFMAHPFLFAVIFGAMGTIRQELQEANRVLIEELRELAIRDPLTEAYNRRHAVEMLRTLLLRSARSGEPVGVALFDLDEFKAVNDLKGHLEGDRVLRNVALALRASVRQGDVIARYGGDEFLLVSEANRETAASLVDRATAAVLGQTGMAISAGIAIGPIDGQTPEALIGTADVRLAQVKRDRRETRQRLRAGK